MAIVAMVIAMFLGSNVKAQTTDSNALRLGIGLEAGLPTGNAHNISNFELGGTARLQYGLSHNVAVMLTSGYYNMFGKGDNNSLGIIPVKAGVKLFAGDGFYFSGEAGAAFETSTDPYTGTKNTKLDLSPGIGYATKTWDFGVRYENFSGNSNSYGLVGLRVAYGFGL